MARRCSPRSQQRAKVQACVRRDSVGERPSPEYSICEDMMIRNILLASAALAVATTPAVATAPRKSTVTAAATLPASNPFARPSTLPLETPDFSKIKDTDYLPALLAGMAQQKREVTAIANQSATPTFENTVAAMERSGLLLERAGLAFNAVNGANTNDVLQATDTKTSPLYAP